MVVVAVVVVVVVVDEELDELDELDVELDEELVWPKLPWPLPVAANTAALMISPLPINQTDRGSPCQSRAVDTSPADVPPERAACSAPPAANATLVIASDDANTHAPSLPAI